MMGQLNAMTCPIAYKVSHEALTIFDYTLLYTNYCIYGDTEMHACLYTEGLTQYTHWVIFLSSSDHTLSYSLFKNL